VLAFPDGYIQHSAVVSQIHEKITEHCGPVYSKANVSVVSAEDRN
jgi:hypothetical protein